jgi:hypothetical protein
MAAHRVRYYLHRRDPAFEEHKAEVLEVYAAAEMLRQMTPTALYNTKSPAQPHRGVRLL